VDGCRIVNPAPVIGIKGGWITGGTRTKQVNAEFMNVLTGLVRSGDILWIHDYHCRCGAPAAWKWKRLVVESRARSFLAHSLSDQSDLSGNSSAEKRYCRHVARGRGGIPRVRPR
jgi:hypothetical protein